MGWRRVELSKVILMTKKYIGSQLMFDLVFCCMLSEINKGLTLQFPSG